MFYMLKILFLIIKKPSCRPTAYMKKLVLIKIHEYICIKPIHIYFIYITFYIYHILYHILNPNLWN